MGFHIPVNPSGMLGKTLGALGHHAPLILTCTAAIGVIGGVVKAVKATPKAVRLLEQEKRKIAEEEHIEFEEVRLTAKEVVKTCWKLYVVPAVSIILAIVCMFASLRIMNSRNIALAGLYSYSQEELFRIQRKLEDTVDKKDLSRIRDEIAREKIEANPPPDDLKPIPGEDLWLFRDDISGRYWLCNRNIVLNAVSMINEQLDHCMYISLNEYYDLVGLDPNGMGEDSGWTVDDKLEVDIKPITSKYGKPCDNVIFNLSPRYNHGYLC